MRDDLPKTTHMISSSLFQDTQRHDVSVNHVHDFLNLCVLVGSLGRGGGLGCSLLSLSETPCMYSLLQSRW